MAFYFSKSKFVSTCTHCNKYAWLDKYKPEEKSPVSEFTETLFDNGHRVGALAQEYFAADVDVTTVDADGKLDIDQMLRKTQEHIRLKTPVIAEASFSHNGLFCSVDILVRNTDGSYDLYEVKSSKQKKPTKKNPLGVQKKYVLDAAYQRLVLQCCGVKVNKVYVVLLAPDYVRGSTLELDRYFVKCDVTADAVSLEDDIALKLVALEIILGDTAEPPLLIGPQCNKCEYFGYCSRNLPTPSVFDVYAMDFSDKCECYYNDVAFVDVPGVCKELSGAAQRQIAYHDRTDAYIDTDGIRAFLNGLHYPLYSLDFETYQAVVPEHIGVSTYEQVPFQFSLHRIAKPDPDLERDLEEHHFLDISGGDTRRAIAENLVKYIPFGASVIAYHHSTEENIVKRLATLYPDLAAHLQSFTYYDPLKVFQDGLYYTAAMGNSFSLKSVAPALFPEDSGMDYHNLEGDIKKGTQAMTAIEKAKTLSSEEREALERALTQYCALDTISVVKILKKFYEVTK